MPLLSTGMENLLSHWLELSHLATSSRKGRWEAWFNGHFQPMNYLEMFTFLNDKKKSLFFLLLVLPISFCNQPTGST